MYKVEVRLAAKTGWHTPAEAKAYYRKYSREGVTWHWWNSPDLVEDSDHDNIVNYILGKAQRGDGSVNYVLSNKKITMLVNPDNVAWASQSGNPTTISVELSPHLNAEGYKKAGWLFNELEGRYGKGLKHYKHSDWFSTACPGTINVELIKKEASNWKNGIYAPQPEWLRNRKAVSHKVMFAKDNQTPLRNLARTGEVLKNFEKGQPFDIAGRTTVNGYPYWITKSSMDADRPAGFDFYELQDANPLKVVEEPKAQNTFALWKDGGTYVANKQPTYLYDVTEALDWSTVKKVGALDKGELIQIVGGVHNDNIDRTYYIRDPEFVGKVAQGFHPADLDVYTPPTTVNKPPKEGEITDPEPLPPTPLPPQPEWLINLIVYIIRLLFKNNKE